MKMFIVIMLSLIFWSGIGCLFAWLGFTVGSIPYQHGIQSHLAYYIGFSIIFNSVGIYGTVAFLWGTGLGRWLEE